MIKLNVENYCKDCPEFKATVDKGDSYVTCVDGIFREVPGDTVVSCAHKARCAAIADYLASLTTKDNTCVCCGKVIPEGRQLCPDCEMNVKPEG
jgi:hypothetical protein